MDPPPFDAVLFDLDGTLLATDRYWIPAARVGTRRAFEELGLERSVPSAAQWMSLVGLPLDDGLAQLFPDLDGAAIARIKQSCVEEEHFALRSGLAALMPGVVDVLESLRADRVRIGIASNCSMAYLETALHAQGLDEYVDEGRCLESPGTLNKADMVEDLLLTFGTRSAVMVGDRAVDRDAAHANGIPHVHLASGFAPASERVECEAVIEDLHSLLRRLRGRQRWIAGAFRALAVDTVPSALRIGITGRSASGKTLFARDAAGLLRSRGLSVRRLSLDDYLAGDAPARRSLHGDPLPPEEHLPRAFDLDAFLRAIEAPDPTASHLLVDGLFLAHPLLRPHLDLLVHLDVPTDLCLRRVRARELPLGRTAEVDLTRDSYLPAQEQFERAYPPERVADLVLHGANPLGPE